MKKESTYKTQDNDKLVPWVKPSPMNREEKTQSQICFGNALEATIPPEQVKNEVKVFLNVSELTLMESMQGLIEVF